MGNSINIPGMELLRFNHAGALQLKDGNTINYGVIRVSDTEMVCFTGKGLREIWKPGMNEEEKSRAEELKKILESDGGEKKLIDSQHIAIIPFRDIFRVIF